MTNSFIDEIYESARHCDALSEFCIIKAYSFTEVTFPVRKPVVSFGSEKTDRMNFLIGADLLESGTERLSVSVLTDEKSGADYCQECSEIVCTQILKLDTDKMIVSVSADRCTFDSNLLAYRIYMSFGLRETAEILEEE